MHGPEWSDLRIFLEVVRAGSAMQASGRLGINHTTVYRRISALEGQLNKRLFKRSSGGWSITPVGERILPYAEAMAEQADGIRRLVLAETEELNGVLRVTADYCADSVLFAAARLFGERHPQIRLQVIATAGEPDIAAGEADIALRVTDEPPPDLIGKRIANVACAVYACRELQERIASDPEAEDIPCIASMHEERSRPAWIEASFPNTRRVYQTTSLPVMLAMARQGIGVARLPCALADPDPALHRIPECPVEPGSGLWLLSHVDLRNTARVRLFRDFLVEELARQKDLIEGRRG